MTSDDKTMLTFMAGLGFVLLLVVDMALNSFNLSKCLSVGMQWADRQCVVIKEKAE